jgi:hypothetical protein
MEHNNSIWLVALLNEANENRMRNILLNHYYLVWFSIAMFVN